MGAVRYELHGLTASELGKDFQLDRILNHGYLPRIYLSNNPRRLLNAYVADYLKEEVAAEGIVRNLPVFSEFLNVASLSDTELVIGSSAAGFRLTPSVQNAASLRRPSFSLPT